MNTERSQNYLEFKKFYVSFFFCWTKLQGLKNKLKFDKTSWTEEKRQFKIV